MKNQSIIGDQCPCLGPMHAVSDLPAFDKKGSYSPTRSGSVKASQSQSNLIKPNPTTASSPGKETYDRCIKLHQIAPKHFVFRFNALTF